MHPYHSSPTPDDWRDEEAPEDTMLQPTSSPRRPNNWATKGKQILQRHWRPQALELPQVDPELHQLSAIERSAETLRFSLRGFEYWLSPQGALREWFRFNARVAVILAIPTVLVVPFITFALGEFNTWATLLAATTANMVLFPLSALLVIGLISGLVYVTKSLLVLRRQPHRRDPYEHY